MRNHTSYSKFSPLKLSPFAKWVFGKIVNFLLLFWLGSFHFTLCTFNSVLLKMTLTAFKIYKITHTRRRKETQPLEEFLQEKKTELSPDIRTYRRSRSFKYHPHLLLISRIESPSQDERIIWDLSYKNIFTFSSSSRRPSWTLFSIFCVWIWA